MTPAAEFDVAWSPDSRKIVYSSERDGPARLFVYDFGTQKNRRSPPLPTIGRPVFAGRQVGRLRASRLRAPRRRPISKTDRTLARGIIADPDSDRASARLVARRPLAGVSSAAGRGGSRTSRSSRPPAASRTPSASLPTATRRAITWGPDGTFLLFDTSQRTEPGQLARVDLILRTPKFREDQFTDLFNEETAPRKPGTPPATVPSEAASPKPRRAARGGRGARNQRHRSRSCSTTSASGCRSCRRALDVGEGFVSPDGKTVVMIAGAAGQQNLYSWSIDETARERPVAKQLTSTAAASRDVRLHARQQGGVLPRRRAYSGGDARQARVTRPSA